MKLRYYLRGLGIGILVTALILRIAGVTRNGMSDAQIRARAAELGMVDSSYLVLGNLQSGSHTGDGGTQLTGDQEPASGGQTEPTVQSPTEDPTEEAQPSDGEGQEPVSGAQPDPDQDPSRSDESAGEENIPDAADDVETVSFTIQSGAGSGTISRSLQQAGLVESAGDFDTYLNENGYSRRLRAGTFSIPVGASMEDIARIITGG